MRRLYLQIYLGFVGILLLFAILVALAWLLRDTADEHDDDFEKLAVLASRILPAEDRPVAELRAALADLHRQFGVDLVVSDPGGTLLAGAGRPLALPEPRREHGGWLHRRGPGWSVALRLPDGRWLHVHVPHRHRHFAWLWGVALLAFAVAVGAYPLARRITRRLERLQAGVEELGAGDLKARVEVHGHDEVAELARSFNRAAGRIEQLVAAQQSTLASASHELRSPLTRIRMAIELLVDTDRPEIRGRVERDIAELDDLIDELLLASRLQTPSRPHDEESIDLLALVAEEGARVGARVEGSQVHVRGERRMLRRAIRNLFENARRYAQGFPIEATVEALGSGGRVMVADSGPGVPETERERIFEPFYRPPGTKEGEDRGVGLGLALVRQIAERHGGAASSLPRPDGKPGGCFEFRISDVPAS